MGIFFLNILFCGGIEFQVSCFMFQGLISGPSAWFKPLQLLGNYGNQPFNLKPETRNIVIDLQTFTYYCCQQTQ
jgi:hypothetical protein